MIDLLESPPARDVQADDTQRDGWYDPDSATFELLDAGSWVPGGEDVGDRPGRPEAVPSEVD